MSIIENKINKGKISFEIKEIIENLPEKTCIYFQLKAMVNKRTIKEEIISTMNGIAEKNFDFILNIIN